MYGFISGLLILFLFSMCHFYASTVWVFIKLALNRVQNQEVWCASFIPSQDCFGYLRSFIVQFEF